jgi:hypothetical protein
VARVEVLIGRSLKKGTKRWVAQGVQPLSLYHFIDPRKGKVSLERRGRPLDGPG